ncbi:MAG: hypothetical protein PF961_14780 [Planctomycetota bacterium]|jgi:RNA polymerase sigma-70 factor (ECF subfamily)|nr:hypothetical protein [Planctomycetota bacterium]
MDDVALERCLQQHGDAVRSYLCGMGVALDMVDDLAQEAFVDYYFQADRRPEEVAELVWIKGIARNKARGLFRSRGRQAALRERFARHLEHTACPSALVADDSMLDQLVRCLDRLSSDEREVLERYYTGDEGAASIGASIGRSAAAVRMAMMRLRDQLRRCVTAAGQQT